jgi:hypothetical protein
MDLAAKLGEQGAAHGIGDGQIGLPEAEVDALRTGVLAKGADQGGLNRRGAGRNQWASR